MTYCKWHFIRWVALDAKLFRGAICVGQSLNTGPRVVELKSLLCLRPILVLFPTPNPTPPPPPRADANLGYATDSVRGKNKQFTVLSPACWHNHPTRGSPAEFMTVMNIPLISTIFCSGFRNTWNRAIDWRAEFFSWVSSGC